MFKSEEAKKAYYERLKRVNDAISLKEPDRVPIFSPVQKYVYDRVNITMKEAMYDFDKAKEACKKFVYDFQPDMDFGPFAALPGKVLDIINLKWLRWPGKGLADNSMFQFLEDEYMKADEYDEFNYDLSYFLLKKWLPRSMGNVSGLSEFPLVRNGLWSGWLGVCLQFSNIELIKAFETLKKAGEESQKFLTGYDSYFEEIKDEGGFPAAIGSNSFAPFDFIGDSLRGTVGVLTDILENPDKLEEALYRMVPVGIDMGVRGSKSTGNPFCWIWLHKGIDSFMSDSQFNRFYWKPFKKMIEGLIDKGINPMIYGEGSLNTRVKYFAELPKGKCIFHVETATLEEMAEIKDTLKDVACISGNIPVTLFEEGNSDDIKNYCKKLIDICGVGGGYIMDTSALLDNAKEENVKVWFDFVKDYGRY